METVLDALAAIDWTTVATVVAAFGALGALGYTAKTDRRSVDRERKAQASGLGVWSEGATYDSNVDPPGWSDFHVVVFNGSDLPIHDVRVDRLPIEWKKKSEAVEARSVSVVLPRSEAPWIPFGSVKGEVPKFHGIPDSPPLRVYFRDNAGIRWVRYPDGRLVEDAE